MAARRKRQGWRGSFGIFYSPMRQRWMVLYSPQHDIGTASVVGTYESRAEAERVVSREPSRDPLRPRGTRAWEVWSKGDRYDEPGFVEAFKDKGEALARIRRLRRSHPYARYELRHKRSTARHHFSTRSRRRYAERRTRS